MRTALASLLILLLVACSASAKGEECGDEGTLGGDCDQGLLCTRKVDNDSNSPLVCLTPCTSNAVCETGELCQGRQNFAACHPQ